jgi:hypothetical protein
MILHLRQHLRQDLRDGGTSPEDLTYEEAITSRKSGEQASAYSYDPNSSSNSVNGSRRSHDSSEVGQSSDESEQSHDPSEVGQSSDESEQSHDPSEVGQSSDESEQSHDPSEDNHSEEGEEHAFGPKTGGETMPNPQPKTGGETMPNPPASFGAPLTDDEQSYIRDVENSATTLLQSDIKNALTKLDFLPAFNQFLNDLENEKKKLTVPGRELVAADKLRRLCWNFKQKWEKKLQPLEQSEAVKTVLEVVSNWAIKANDFESKIDRLYREKCLAYIKNVFNLATSLDIKFSTDDKFHEALDALHLSQPFDNINFNLVKAGMKDVDKHDDYGSLIDVSNQIRRELKQFKEACKEKIKYYTRAGDMFIEAIQIVGDFINLLTIPETDFVDSSAVILPYSDGEEDRTSFAVGARLENVTYDIVDVNANPYLLPESLFFDTKYY